MCTIQFDVVFFLLRITYLKHLFPINMVLIFHSPICTRRIFSFRPEFNLMLPRTVRTYRMTQSFAYRSTITKTKTITSSFFEVIYSANQKIVREPNVFRPHYGHINSNAISIEYETLTHFAYEVASNLYTTHTHTHALHAL